MAVARLVPAVLGVVALLGGCANGSKAERLAYVQAMLDREAEEVYGVGSVRDEVRARIERPSRSIPLAPLAAPGTRERAEQERLRTLAMARQWPAVSVDQYPRVTSSSRSLLFVEDSVFYDLDSRVLGVIASIVGTE